MNAKITWKLNVSIQTSIAIFSKCTVTAQIFGLNLSEIVSVLLMVCPFLVSVSVTHVSLIMIHDLDGAHVTKTPMMWDIAASWTNSEAALPMIHCTGEMHQLHNMNHMSPYKQ